MTYILFNLIDTMIFESIDVLFIDKLIYRFYSSSQSFLLIWFYCQYLHQVLPYIFEFVMLNPDVRI